jgi:hypothetical protein
MRGTLLVGGAGSDLQVYLSVVAGSRCNIGLGFDAAIIYSASLGIQLTRQIEAP